MTSYLGASDWSLLRPIPADGEAYVDEYNAELDKLAQEKKNTWFTAPWLFAEYVCHLYFMLAAQDVTKL